MSELSIASLTFTVISVIWFFIWMIWGIKNGGLSAGLHLGFIVFAATVFGYLAGCK